MSLSPRQWVRLHQRLVHAQQHIPLYRDLWGEAGVDARELRAPEDLALLPALTRERIRAVELSDRLDPRFDTSELRESSTSGSTGEPLRLLLDKRSQRHRQIRFLRALWRCGYRPGQRVMLISSRSAQSIKRVSRAAPLLRWNYIDLYEGEQRVLEQFLAIRPHVLYGPVSPLMMLAASLKRAHISHTPPRLLVSTGEQLTASSRRQIEASIGTTVTDFYGLTETGLIAWQRAGSDLWEVDESGLFLEFLPHPQTGDCEQLLVTDLVGGAMPLFRYQTGDLVRRHTGRTGAPISAFLGKQLDQLRMPDGTHIGPYAVDGALVDLPGLSRYQVVQQPDLDLEVFIEGDSAELLPAARRALEHLCSGQVGVTARPWAFDPTRSHKARPVTSLASAT